MCILIFWSCVCFHVKNPSVIGKKIDDPSPFNKCWSWEDLNVKAFLFSVWSCYLPWIASIIQKERIYRKYTCERTSKFNFHLTRSFLTSWNTTSSTEHSPTEFIFHQYYFLIGTKIQLLTSLESFNFTFPSSASLNRPSLSFAELVTFTVKA